MTSRGYDRKAKDIRLMSHRKNVVNVYFNHLMVMRSENRCNYEIYKENEKYLQYISNVCCYYGLFPQARSAAAQLPVKRTEKFSADWCAEPRLWLDGRPGDRKGCGQYFLPVTALSIAPAFLKSPLHTRYIKVAAILGIRVVSSSG